VDQTGHQEDRRKGVIYQHSSMIGDGLSSLH